MTSSSRNRRYRARRDNGKAVLHVEVNLFEYVEMLKDIGMIKEWDDNDPRRAELVARRCATAEDVAAWVHEIHKRKQPPKSIPSTQSIKSTHREIAANTALVLIGVTTALLKRQIAAQAAAFAKEGGFTERLHRVRTAQRNASRRS